MTELILTRGLPASGKTTWAKAFVDLAPRRARVSRDGIRREVFGANGTLPFDQEQVITRMEEQAVRALLETGHTVVVDATHLRPKCIRRWQRLALARGVPCTIREFPIDPEEAIARDARRERSVGERVIAHQAATYMRKGEFLPVAPLGDDDGPGEEYVPDTSLPAAVIVDIDGTVALMDGRGPYDYDRVGTDLPNWPVIEAVEDIAGAGTQIIFCSGRPDSCAEDTIAWLDLHINAGEYELFMRPTGDMRKDSIVKRELFDTNIRNNYNVRLVIDDRKQVVDMWRGLGLTVMQVAEGDF